MIPKEGSYALRLGGSAKKKKSNKHGTGMLTPLNLDAQKVGTSKSEDLKKRKGQMGGSKSYQLHYTSSIAYLKANQFI